ncbi:MAG: hypothetical protein NT001_03115, partial [Candidatus Woesearchaeota archaeon]|nr:hypothetical protein [Candidatus Woesearchaeota archaeon]
DDEEQKKRDYDDITERIKTISEKKKSLPKELKEFADIKDEEDKEEKGDEDQEEDSEEENE